MNLKPFIVIAPLLACVVFSSSGTFVLNVTQSLPIGLYKKVERTPEILPKGSIVTVCLRNDEQGQISKEHASITSGNCPERMGRLVKVVRGTPHDAVHWSEEGVFVNGELIPNSKPFSKDTKGRDLPQIRETRFLNDDEYVLLGLHPKSFDSRYLGVFHRSQIQDIIEPLMTLPFNP